MQSQVSPRHVTLENTIKDTGTQAARVSQGQCQYVSPRRQTESSLLLKTRNMEAGCESRCKGRQNRQFRTWEFITTTKKKSRGLVR